MKIATTFCAVLAMTALALSVRAEVSGNAALGQPAPQFSLQDQNGKTVSLSDYAGKIVVLEWVNPNCPFVQRHYKEKTMINLADNYAGKGAVWLAINSTSDATNQTNLSWVNQNSLSYPILNDSKGEVGKAYNAKTTPDMYIIDKDGKLLYSGAIDNDPQGERGTARINYVQKALNEILAGSPVSVPETKSYGCKVHYAG